VRTVSAEGMPTAWREAQDEGGTTYYWNTETRATQWDEPEELKRNPRPKPKAPKAKRPKKERPKAAPSLPGELPASRTLPDGRSLCSVGEVGVFAAGVGGAAGRSPALAALQGWVPEALGALRALKRVVVGGAELDQLLAQNAKPLPVGLSGLSAGQAKAALRSRGLPAYGKKAELLRRLEQARPADELAYATQRFAPELCFGPHGVEVHAGQEASRLCSYAELAMVQVLSGQLCIQVQASGARSAIELGCAVRDPAAVLRQAVAALSGSGGQHATRLLITAALMDDTTTLVQLLDEGRADGSAPGWLPTPLLEAAAAGNTPAVGALLDRGVAHSVATEDGLTALHLSVLGGHLNCMQRCLQVCDTLARTGSGDTVLTLAIKGKRVDIVQAVVEQLFSTTLRELLDAKSAAGLLPIEQAAASNDVATFSFLLRRLYPADEAARLTWQEAVRLKSARAIIAVLDSHLAPPGQAAPPVGSGVPEAVQREEAESRVIEQVLGAMGKEPAAVGGTPGGARKRRRSGDAPEEGELLHLRIFAADASTCIFEPQAKARWGWCDAVEWSEDGSWRLVPSSRRYRLLIDSFALDFGRDPLAALRSNQPIDLSNVGTISLELKRGDLSRQMGGSSAVRLGRLCGNASLVAQLDVGHSLSKAQLTDCRAFLTRAAAASLERVTCADAATEAKLRKEMGEVKSFEGVAIATASAAAAVATTQ